jgi:hypothetical protein
VNRNLRFSAELGLIYLNNPKAGCSTLKFSLWTAVDRLTGRNTFTGKVHDRRVDPFARDVFALDESASEIFSRSPMFSVVRNPYSRILAAYLNKIPNDPHVWTVFHEGFGLRPDLDKNDLPFRDFLRLIAVAPPSLLDGHFRPQCDNLLLPLTKPAFIGYLEDMGSVGDFLAGFGVEIQNHVQHATHSADRLKDYCDPECSDLIRDIHAEDFKLLGYSAALDDGHEKGRWTADGADQSDLIRQWIAGEAEPENTILDLSVPKRFGRAGNREQKEEIIRAAVMHDDDWARLQRYARIAKRKFGDGGLSAAIQEKMSVLRARYEQAVGNPSIFRKQRARV